MEGSGHLSWRTAGLHAWPWPQAQVSPLLHHSCCFEGLSQGYRSRLLVQHCRLNVVFVCEWTVRCALWLGGPSVGQKTSKTIHAKNKMKNQSKWQKKMTNGHHSKSIQTKSMVTFHGVCIPQSELRCLFNAIWKGVHVHVYISICMYVHTFKFFF